VAFSSGFVVLGVGVGVGEVVLVGVGVGEDGTVCCVL
jgi:hypothetical protein